jgi:hypothetical protein
MNDILVIVPCGTATIWDHEPWSGPTEAYNAYRGTPFKLNRAYAERFADRWMMLSPKFGFIRPNFSIAEPYDVSFRKKSSNPVHIDTLREQVEEFRLSTFRVAVGLGGREYRWVVELAFENTGVITVFPFADLPLGTKMNVIKHAIEVGDSGIPRLEPRKPILS